jgi:hypothetical protein
VDRIGHEMERTKEAVVTYLRYCCSICLEGLRTTRISTRTIDLRDKIKISDLLNISKSANEYNVTSVY